FLGSLLALALFTTVVSSEIQTGTIRVTLSKPLPRWAYLVGRMLGAAIIVTAYGVIVALAQIVLGTLSDMHGATRILSSAWLSLCGHLILGTVALALSLFFRAPVAAVVAWFASA